MANTASSKEKEKMGMTAKNRILSVIATGFFVVLCALVVFPVFAGLLASFRPGSELIRRGLSLNLDFSTMSLDNYIYLFSGNADSMYKFKLQNVILFLVIATMMVPFEILMLPLYQEMMDLNLMNTTAGVILPGLCGASTIFFFRQYMIGLPKDLLDAGRIDGCTEYGICVKIILPITKPAFASMAILSTMGSWNNLLWPMMVYRDADKFTLPIGLNTLLTPYGNNYDVLIAGSMFGIIPILVVFLCFQRYFIDGMVTGAVKG